MDSQLLYFDAGFFQNLTKVPKGKDEETWQRGIIDWINANLRPWRALCPPLNFLELIGITAFPHPVLTPLKVPKAERPKGPAFGKLISESLVTHYEEAYRFYSRLPQLSPGELIAATNTKRNIYMSRLRHVRLICDETIYRFIKEKGFEEQIWHFLAFDRVQVMLRESPNSVETTLRHLQFMQEFLRQEAAEANLPLFRALGLIWKIVEPKMLLKGTLFKLRTNEDLGDCEFLYYAVMGLYSQRSLAKEPVTVLTLEKPEPVRRKLAVAKHLMNLFSEELISDRLNIEFMDQRPGRVVCFKSAVPEIEAEIDGATVPPMVFQDIPGVVPRQNANV